MNTNQGFGPLLAQLGYHGLLREGKCKNCIVKWTLNPAKVRKFRRHHAL